VVLARSCCGVGPTYLYKRGHSRLFVGDGLRAPKGSGFWVRYWVELRGIGPARAGKLGGGVGADFFDAL
jgi:hypothetical protein